jgi:glycosyltransferase involved in cell wall biosynthesis
MTFSTQPFKLFIASGIFHPESGGPATYLYELLPELQKLGWEVRALSYGSGPVDAYPYPLQRIPRISLPLRMMQYARAAYPLGQWADVMYLHTLGLPVIGNKPRIVKIVGDQAWERSIRKGWIAPTEDIDDFQTRRYNPVVSAQQVIRAREVRGMDGVIVPSAYLKRMVTGWGVDPAKIQVIYNALPPDYVAPEVTQAEARTRLGLSEQPLLLTAARLTPWKGVDHLIHALGHVPDVHLLVAGDGDLFDQLVGQTQRMGLEKRVTFLGRVPRDKMALYMKAADYVALYSGYEGLSHTLLESLRAGTPVIASDKGGNPEVVQHGVNGLLIPYVNIEALRAGLIEAFQPGKRAALARNSSIGMERFDFRALVNQTAAALSGFIQKQR